jgi:catechol 2,3-dioxygenase-like lactoylglutathione lyase family enzyme
MSNVHIHLHVSDLETSRKFYEQFLGAEPVKVRPGYVKFLPSLAPINLALSAGEAGAGKTVDHLGFQVETRDAVAALLERVKATGIAVREELGSDCCYANQDKFWVRDPDGIEWEIYHLNYDLEDEALPSTKDATCCTPLARLSKRPPAG